MGEKVIIGVADDEHYVHDGLDRLAAKAFPNAKIEHFYDTSSLKDYLYDEPYGLDVLLLDVHFEGGESGIEALPKIREYAPSIPVLLMTAENDPDLIGEATVYHIDYLPKPVSENSLIIHIRSALHKKEAWTGLLSQIDDLAEYAEMVETMVDGKLDTDIKKAVERVFSDVEFTTGALATLIDSRMDERVLKVLKTIDWRMKPTESMHAKIYRHMKDENVWEYRFSHKGRVFVQYRKDEKPLIKWIDFNHTHKV
ncbi:MAG: response regulator [Solirubrobacterales bacterium]